MFKAKRLIEKGGPAISTSCPDNLSRQFLSTASTFPYSSKNSSAVHIDAFYICLCVRERVCVCVWVNESVCGCVCLSKWVNVFVRVRHVDKAWICSAEEFLELYEKVEALVRNCLLRWSWHLAEVAGTPFSISLFALNILAFFVLRKEHFSAGLEMLKISGHIES